MRETGPFQEKWTLPIIFRVFFYLFRLYSAERASVRAAIDTCMHVRICSRRTCSSIGPQSSPTAPLAAGSAEGSVHLLRAGRPSASVGHGSSAAAPRPPSAGKRAGGWRAKWGSTHHRRLGWPIRANQSVGAALDGRSTRLSNAGLETLEA